MPSLISLLTRRIKNSCAVWEITLKCNSKCIHCGSNAGCVRSDELNTEEALKLVKDLHLCGYKGVALMGGEPLIREDWFEIAKEVKKFKMALSIVTNGLNVVNHIQKLKHLNVDCVSLSLDGGIPETHDYLRGIKGAYDITINAMNLLKKEQLPVSIITAINKINLKEVDLIKNLILDQNISWQIQLAVPIGRLPKELAISREEYYALAMFIAINIRKYSYRRLPVIGAHCFGYFSRFIPNLGLTPWVGCQAGYSVLGIQSNGNIKGCLTLSDKYIEGNVRTQNLREIIKNPHAFKYSRNFEKKHLKGYCKSCNVVDECRGGCLGTRNALKSENAPYCLRAIEDTHFNSKIHKLKGKMDLFLSKYKNLYSNILNI
ncbi:MAG: radical SAM protein [Candidatus Thorarchaeota archaeon]